MSHLGLSLLLLLVLSVTLTCLDAAPADRVKISDVSNRTSKKGWMMTLQTGHFTPSIDRPPLESNRQKRSQMEKRKCNTATCVTQRLADYLVRSSNNHGPIYAPTNVGSYTYGKRDIVGLLQRKFFDYLQH
ncbi:islet amyloid polypeptide isoform X1 [Bufo bufo]|uniref:islet amyloid polypeptide isoform X1 n=1 Tax=Bufo bufo TaxID=8384 RepID=UPI001ABE0EC7|nr:islet amyloid polypeptide isoform X1 [Bufo bufo]